MGVLLVFHQTYQPVLGSILLSALVAGLPLYVLFIMLAVLRLPAWLCAVAAMLTAFVLGWLVWGMPFTVTAGAATQGMAFGLWPISWIVLNAVFFHNLTVASGDFDIIKRSLAHLTTDRRIQALLVAFSFGALIEGIAGFGAPVAISASILASHCFASGDHARSGSSPTRRRRRLPRARLGASWEEPRPTCPAERRGRAPLSSRRWIRRGGSSAPSRCTSSWSSSSSSGRWETCPGGRAIRLATSRLRWPLR